ncbi:hypothetical protein PF005_g10003 [Phytophthora fragariae]|uniref:Uncharacterized protein n=1 Tax=Phytophthora fragariae TaxID=53985 RepID=A0A6A3U2L0_9STRA|nr:hypothetical protein PF003_g30486 [Phytophthora fragariae]KAE8938361.1 hypothetical protein PF009_g11753 [Phytophthora fragariae]KAE9011517.1 hypothetical protein PF011_g9345 [Phytophthora fragariae]KAE9113673.1 hypothetical protein PF007_g10654 [Phytophthora fragariae]KAE9113719.1 hypothetical protein PF010_g9977 [Phytophthora fragariae]
MTQPPKIWGSSPSWSRIISRRSALLALLRDVCVTREVNSDFAGDDFGGDRAVCALMADCSCSWCCNCCLNGGESGRARTSSPGAAPKKPSWSRAVRRRTSWLLGSTNLVWKSRPLACGAHCIGDVGFRKSWSPGVRYGVRVVGEFSCAA